MAKTKNTFTRADLRTELVGIREIAEMLVAEGRYADVNQARSSVTTLISRRDPTIDNTGRQTRAGNDFPSPVAELAATGVYLRSEVKAWFRDAYGTAPIDADPGAPEPVKPGRRKAEAASF